MIPNSANVTPLHKEEASRAGSDYLAKAAQQQARQIKALRTALGDLLKYVDDDNVTEIYVNDDYVVRLDTFAGRVKTDILLTESRVKTICETIAGINDTVITYGKPSLGVEIQSMEIRSQIQYPPIVSRPTFFLRKKPRTIFTLEEYKSNETLSEHYYSFLVNAIKRRKNIVVAGATGSGKTTFLNALLLKLTELCPRDRLLLLEDLPELQCAADDYQRLTTSNNKATIVTMQDLVRDAMRLSPTRILIGEVRDRCAYDMLKAWNTGHEGGFCTLHAKNCEDALLRLELLVKEASVQSSTDDIKGLISSSVHYVASIQKEVIDGRTVRQVKEVIEVLGYNAQTKSFDFNRL